MRGIRFFLLILTFASTCAAAEYISYYAAEYDREIRISSVIIDPSEREVSWGHELISMRPCPSDWICWLDGQIDFAIKRDWVPEKNSSWRFGDVTYRVVDSMQHDCKPTECFYLVEVTKKKEKQPFSLVVYSKQDGVVSFSVGGYGDGRYTTYSLYGQRAGYGSAGAGSN